MSAEGFSYEFSLGSILEQITAVVLLPPAMVLFRASVFFLLDLGSGVLSIAHTSAVVFWQPCSWGVA